MATVKTSPMPVASTETKSVTDLSKKGYSAKYIVAMSFLVIIGVINSRYILRIIPYTKEHKPYDDFKIKDLSNFWVTALCALVHVLVKTTYEKLSLPFWVKYAKK